MTSAQSGNSCISDKFQKPENRCQHLDVLKLTGAEKKRAKNKKKKQNRKKAAREKKKQEESKKKEEEEEEEESSEDEDEDEEENEEIDPRWWEAKSFKDLLDLNIEFITGKLHKTPYYRRGLDAESKKLIPSLIKAHNLSIFTYQSQPGHSIIGQYAKHENSCEKSIIGSYVDYEQRAFVEFFTDHKTAEILMKKLSDRNDLTYAANNPRSRNYTGNFKNYFERLWVTRYRFYKRLGVPKPQWNISASLNMSVGPDAYWEDFGSKTTTDILKDQMQFIVIMNKACDTNLIEELNKLVAI